MLRAVSKFFLAIARKLGLSKAKRLAEKRRRQAPLTELSARVDRAASAIRHRLPAITR